MKRLLRRLLLSIVLTVLALTGAAVWIDRHVASYSAAYIVPPEEAPKADAILVLGASVRANGQVSPMLQARLDRALALYRAGAAPKILVSGDHRSADYDETGAMKRYLTERKVPGRSIVMDHAGLSTYESMYRARHMFEAGKVLVVTQSYHLKRAVYVARALGLDAYGVEADAGGTSGAEEYRFREFLARNKDFLFARMLRPVPPDLGEKQPIQGEVRPQKP